MYPRTEIGELEEYNLKLEHLRTEIGIGEIGGIVSEWAT